MRFEIQPLTVKEFIKGSAEVRQRARRGAHRCLRPAELHAVSTGRIKHRHQEDDLTAGKDGWMGESESVKETENEREREGSESRNVTPNSMLTPINQRCSEARTLLCCPLPHFSSIWIRSAHRPKRARRHGDPVRLSGSKRERAFFFLFFFSSSKYPVRNEHKFSRAAL